jgi:hypothetical protein
VVGCLGTIGNVASIVILNNSQITNFFNQLLRYSTHCMTCQGSIPHLPLEENQIIKILERKATRRVDNFLIDITMTYVGHPGLPPYLWPLAAGQMLSRTGFFHISPFFLRFIILKGKHSLRRALRFI